MYSVKRILISVVLFVFTLTATACSGGFKKSSDRVADNFSSAFRSVIWKPKKSKSAETTPVEEKEEEEN